MFREHSCNTGPIPTGCNYSYVPPWIGIKVLGGRDRHDATNTRLKPGMVVSVAAWNYAPGDAARDEDTERYALMAGGARPPTTPPRRPPRARRPDPERRARRCR